MCFTFPQIYIVGSEFVLIFQSLCPHVSVGTRGRARLSGLVSKLGPNLWISHNWEGAQPWVGLGEHRCNGRWWKKVRTKVQRGTCSAFYKYNWTLNNKVTKGTTKTAPSGATHAKQKITTHKTHVGKSYLSMVLNQRQRQTAYPAKNKEIQKRRKKNIERPP
jgi:hypothetical protein